MDAFEACVSCARYIRRTETACPFCRSTHTPSAPRARRPSRRMSRSAWLATTLVSGLALAGCSGASIPGDPSTENPTEGMEDASADTAGEAGTDTSTDDGATQDAFPAQTADSGVLAEDAGQEDSGQHTGWHGCYGSPPARPERRARTSAAA
jgi:hypothetical protein